MHKRGTIFFDLTQLLLRVFMPTPSGIGRVELAYARHLIRAEPENVVFVFALTRFVRVIPHDVATRYVVELARIWQSANVVSPDIEDRLREIVPGHILNPQLSRAGFALKHANTVRRYWLAVRTFGRLLMAPGRHKLCRMTAQEDCQNAYISVSNCLFFSPWIIKWLERSPSTKRIYLLHDIIPITNPEFTVPHITARHHSYVRRLTDTADTIIANSTFTKHCLKDFVAESGWRLPDIVVAPLGIDDIFTRIDSADGDCAPYFVFTATIEPRKNHLMLLQVWQRLVAEYGQRAPRLILVGRRGWENENILDVIDRAQILRDFVIECSNVSDALMVKLLRNARAALFPSHLEGYGLPLAEALSLDVPVICSDIPPFKEIAGDVPEYADPLAGRGWLKLIVDYTSPTSGRRAAQIERMRRYRVHRWDDHFEVLHHVLQEAKVIPVRERPIARDILSSTQASSLESEARNALSVEQIAHFYDAIADALSRLSAAGELRLFPRMSLSENSRLAFYRGLRCLIVMDLDRSSQEANPLSMAAAAATFDVAHIVIKILVPPVALESRDAIDLVKCAVRYSVTSSRIANKEFRTGPLSQVLTEIRGLYQKLSKDDGLRRPVDVLRRDLKAVSVQLLVDAAVCDELSRVLAAGPPRRPDAAR